MSHMKQLDELVGRMRQVADDMKAVADMIEYGFSVSKSDEPVAQPSLDTVRAALARKSEQGYTDQIRALLEKHGAKKLTAIDPSHYAALLADAEALV